MGQEGGVCCLPTVCLIPLQRDIAPLAPFYRRENRRPSGKLLAFDRGVDAAGRARVQLEPTRCWGTLSASQGLAIRLRCKWQTRKTMGAHSSSRDPDGEYGERRRVSDWAWRTLALPFGMRMSSHSLSLL